MGHEGWCSAPGLAEAAVFNTKGCLAFDAHGDLRVDFGAWIADEGAKGKDAGLFLGVAAFGGSRRRIEKGLIGGAGGDGVGEGVVDLEDGFFCAVGAVFGLVFDCNLWCCRSD